MDRLEEFEKVSRLSRELQLHLGVGDQDLAEYLLALSKKHAHDGPSIRAELGKEGVVLPDTLLHTLVSIANPPATAASEFKVLSMPNDTTRAADLCDTTPRDADRESRSNQRQHDVAARERSRERPRQWSRDQRHRRPRDGGEDCNLPRKRLTSPERFELKQLLASGAIDPHKHRDLVSLLNDDRQSRRADAATAPPVELDVELADSEPDFLKGTHRLVAELSPVRIVKNPTGTLARAAMQGAVSAAARRDRKQSDQRGAEKEAIRGRKQDLAVSWNDPMASDRLLADALKQLDRRRDADYPRPVDQSCHQPSTHHHNNHQPSTHLPSPPHTTRTIKEERDGLPIAMLRGELMEAVRQHRTLVIIGETGSGKTTQITQYLAEEGYCLGNKRIGCTQPRRVAAMSVAKRVAEEVGCPLGAEVGYTIRFEDCTSPSTAIKYMTDGMLLRECLVDPLLSSYSVVVLDEAHERTVHTDVLFGLCKQALQSRPHDLRLLITSATLDADKFTTYFDQCPVFTIPGRSFPVDIVYAEEPCPDYLEAAIECCLKIHSEQPPGDILLFLTGQEEIDSAVEVLYARSKRLNCPLQLLPLPVYSALPNEQQTRIFGPAPPGFRKVVVATNIAETSLTIDGILYVVDPGFCKQKSFNPRLSMDTLSVTPISQAQARQRAGRAGRTGPGKCYRLYTESAFHNEMLPTAVPEIQRTNLAVTVLTLKAMGINDLVGFDFMDRPPLPVMLAAMESLFQLGALDNDGFLTKAGRRMADFPLDPPQAKCLLAALDLDCTEAMLSVVALTSAGGSTIFFRPRDRQEQADQKRLQFVSRDGDLLTYLRVYQGWLENGRSAHWCQEHYVQHRTLKRAHDIRKQLASILARWTDARTSSGDRETGDGTAVRRALCAGLFRQAARRDRSGEQGGYRTLLDDHPVAVHPSSVLSPAGHHASTVTPPAFLLYGELVMTGREWLRDVTPIDPAWLVQAAPTLYKHPDEGRLSQRQKAERIVPLHNPHDKNEEWRLSKQAAFYKAARSR